MLTVKRFTFSLFGVNTYIAADSDTKKAIVIDPAMDDKDEERIFADYVESSGLHITNIVNTHLHLDHCFGEDFVRDKYGARVMAHPDDAVLGRIIDQQYQMFGMRPQGRKVEIDVPLSDGDVIEVGKSRLEVIATPGHTPGGISLYDKADHLLFSGDTIFRQSVGRTDLPGGSQRQLMHSVRERILSLPDQVTIYPGHGDSTTVAYEKLYNPFA